MNTNNIEAVATAHWANLHNSYEYAVHFYQLDKYNNTSYGVDILITNLKTDMIDEIEYESPAILTFEQGLDLYQAINKLYNGFCELDEEIKYPQYTKYIEEQNKRLKESGERAKLVAQKYFDNIPFFEAG